MSKYLARLKEIETGNYFDKSLGIEVSEVTKDASDTFGTLIQAHFEKKLPIQFNVDKEKNISFSCIEEVSKVSKGASDTFDTAIQAEKQKKISFIQSWLFKIGEPEEYHHIVLDKCKANSETLEYFLKHVRGEFE